MNGKNPGIRITVITFATALLAIGGYVQLSKDEPTPQKEPVTISALSQNGLKLTKQRERLPKNPSWQDLNVAQRDALSPLSGEWNALNADRKQKWLHVAHKYFMMNLEQQQRAQKRMRAWVSLTADQREIARENYARTLEMDSHKKAMQWERYQQLPGDQKQKLAKTNKAKKRITNLPSSETMEALGVPPFKSGLKDDRPMTAQALPSEK